MNTDRALKHKKPCSSVKSVKSVYKGFSDYNPHFHKPDESLYALLVPGSM